MKKFFSRFELLQKGVFVTIWFEWTFLEIKIHDPIPRSLGKVLPQISLFESFSKAVDILTRKIFVKWVMIGFWKISFRLFLLKKLCWFEQKNNSWIFFLEENCVFFLVKIFPKKIFHESEKPSETHCLNSKNKYSLLNESKFLDFLLFFSVPENENLSLKNTFQ